LAEIIIPAPSNGVFPASVLLEHLKVLEASGLAFLEGGFVERADYQRRALGFCLERLHSYLVQKALRNHGVEINTVQGFHTVISDGPGILATQ
jgi:Ni,Fe-hydrogenase III large subunit